MNRSTVVAILCALLFIGGFTVIITGGLFPAPEPGVITTFGGAGSALWKGRTPEVIFQGFILLSGIISIVLLLGPDRSGGKEP